MTTRILGTLPGSNDALRQAVYAGGIFLIPANDDSTALVAKINSLIRAAFAESADPQKIHETLSEAEIFNRAQILRNVLKNPDYGRNPIVKLAGSLGFAAADNLADVLRLRVATHDGFKNPAAAAAFTAHRDTWYANPQAQINWWIPLYDVEEQQTFRFFPALFNRAVANSSSTFDYDTWSGFQSGDKKNTVYPTAAEIPRTETLDFSARAGDILIFSAAHLHQTNANASGKTRFSLDFRTVHQADLAQGLGAPNADNASRGHAEKDYIPLKVAP